MSSSNDRHQTTDDLRQRIDALSERQAKFVIAALLLAEHVTGDTLAKAIQLAGTVRYE